MRPEDAGAGLGHKASSVPDKHGWRRGRVFRFVAVGVLHARLVDDAGPEHRLERTRSRPGSHVRGAVARDGRLDSRGVESLAGKLLIHVPNGEMLTEILMIRACQDEILVLIPRLSRDRTIQAYQRRRIDR